MTFTKTPPTTSGFYATQHCEGKFLILADVYLTQSGKLAAVTSGIVHNLEYFQDYEWCRLVPSEEVEKAWDECVGFDSPRWKTSRAKRVAEGTE